MSNNRFRIWIRLSQKKMTIIPQGQITLSYVQLMAGLASLTLFISATVPMLSQFIPSDLLLNLPTLVKDDDSNTDDN